MIFRVKGMSFAHEVMITCTNDVNVRQILRKKRNTPHSRKLEQPLKFLNTLNS